MKKICSVVRLVVGAVALGETIASYHKDENFRKNIKDAKGLNKFKVAFDNLVEINSNIFNEAKNIDYKSIIDEKKAYINEKINYLKEEGEKINNKKIKPILEDIQKKYNEIEKIAIEKKDKFLDKYGEDIEKFVQKIGKNIAEIKEKITKEEK